jgi:hypothetical protein
MAHDHNHFHSKEDLNSYLVQQLFTIFISGALGAVALSLYAQGMLGRFLATPFHKWVVLGGSGLLLLVVIRAIALWRFVGNLPPIHDHAHDNAHDHVHDHQHDDACCGHSHDHDHAHAHAHAASNQAVTTPAAGGLSLNVLASPAPPASLPLAGATAEPHHHDHDHDHDCCGHDHDHGHDQAPAVEEEDGHDHDHGWAPWRVVLLMLPVVLYFLNLPSPVLGSDYKPIVIGDLDTSNRDGADGDGKVDYDVGFTELENASLRPDLRANYSSKTVRLVGQYVNIDDQHFTLVRLKMNCCAPDAIPIKAVIVIDPTKAKESKMARLDPRQYRNKWVEVVGQVHFFNRRGTNEFYSALVVSPTEDKPLSKQVSIVPQPANPYVN